MHGIVVTLPPAKLTARKRPKAKVPAAFILAGEMAVAYFMAHAPKGFFPLVNGGTLAIAYCFACLYLATAGAGPWSLDAAMNRK